MHTLPQKSDSHCKRNSCSDDIVDWMEVVGGQSAGNREFVVYLMELVKVIVTDPMK
jgi:hypothetical protein